MLVKCRDLRILPGTKFRLPGTLNYSAPLLVMDSFGPNRCRKYVLKSLRILGQRKYKKREFLKERKIYSPLIVSLIVLLGLTGEAHIC